MADKLKLVAAMLIIAIGVGGFYYLSDMPEVVRWLALLVTVGIATAVALTSAPGKAALEFAKVARGELRKVVWPTRRETAQVTLVVVLLVIVVAVFLWVVDWGLDKMIRLLMSPRA